MIRKVRLLLLIEGATFALAALIHFGVLLEGYEHGRAVTVSATGRPRRSWASRSPFEAFATPMP